MMRKLASITLMKRKRSGQSHFRKSAIRWKQVRLVVTKLKARMSQSPSTRAPNEKLLPANYVADEIIKKIITIVINYNRTAVERLPSPWREKF